MNTDKILEDYRKDIEQFNVTKFKSINFTLMMLYIYVPACLIVYFLNSGDIIGNKIFHVLQSLGLFLLFYGILPLIFIALLTDIIMFIKVKRKQRRLVKDAEDIIKK